VSDPEKKKRSVEAKSSSKPDAKTSGDVVLVHGVTEDRRGLKVLRARNERLEVGEVRPVEEGKPIAGDLVRLKPREGAPHVCDVETELSISGQSSPTVRDTSARGRPAQVATDTYRDNWDSIFKSKLSSPGSSELN